MVACDLRTLTDYVIPCEELHCTAIFLTVCFDGKQSFF